VLDQLGFVEPDRDSMRALSRVRRRFRPQSDPGVEQRFGEVQRRISRPGIRVEDDSSGREAGVASSAGEKRLFQRRH
jgi:hypothetical protein